MAQTNHPCLRLSVQDVLCRAEKERGKGLARSYETTSDLGEVYHAWDDSDNQLHSIGTGNIAQGTIKKNSRHKLPRKRPLRKCNRILGRCHH